MTEFKIIMNKEYTHIALVVDRSGSMGSQWAGVKEGYAEIIRSNQEAEGTATFSLVGFDSMVETFTDFQDIQEVSEDIPFSPRGATSLFDAVGLTINKTGEALAIMDEADRPANVIVIIQTDGYENSSQEFKASQVAEMVKKQEDEYNWNFMFIGAGKEFFDQADSMGLGGSFTSYSGAKSADAYEALGQKTQMFRSMSVKGDLNAAASLKFTAEEESDLN